MNSLLIDTHDTKVSFVLYKDGILKDKIEVESNMRHSEIAMPSLIELIKKNNLVISDISEILVVIGPGSFTGVRIGVVISKTIAYLLNIPIKCLTSLDIIVMSSDDIKEGKYYISEKNGYFVGKYNSQGKVIDGIQYFNKNDFNACDAITCEKIDYNNVYRHSIKIESINPHLVNPLYVKQIEALK